MEKGVLDGIGMNKSSVEKVEKSVSDRTGLFHDGQELTGSLIPVAGPVGGSYLKEDEGEDDMEHYQANQLKGVNVKKAKVEASNVDVSEVYSPPRVTTTASQYGLRPGEAMDLMTGYDFSKKEDRERARQS